LRGQPCCPLSRLVHGERSVLGPRKDWIARTRPTPPHECPGPGAGLSASCLLDPVSGRTLPATPAQHPPTTAPLPTPLHPPFPGDPHKHAVLSCPLHRLLPGNPPRLESSALFLNLIYFTKGVVTPCLSSEPLKGSLWCPILSLCRARCTWSEGHLCHMTPGASLPWSAAGPTTCWLCELRQAP